MVDLAHDALKPRLMLDPYCDSDRSNTRSPSIETKSMAKRSYLTLFYDLVYSLRIALASVLEWAARIAFPELEDR